ncbi:putative transposable element-related protein [Cucumis melo var. makuwa]|uniref:Putative transposable element-related protein n=1 Tax=Cucumis melo var. makuwa TaxID=1194695 RepID=A0A5D3BQB8_CUCMM|nr:putative transposable element-related protein [Cucumis melo var. makuwa]
MDPTKRNNQAKTMDPTKRNSLVKRKSLGCREDDERKKIKVVKSDRVGEYYGRYDGSGKQRPGSFAKYLEECGIVLQYTMPGQPSMNGVVERRNRTLKDMTPISEFPMESIIEQDNNDVPEVKTQQSQEVPLRRSTREKRSAILDVYIMFLQEHQDEIGIMEDDPINF